MANGLHASPAAGVRAGLGLEELRFRRQALKLTNDFTQYIITTLPNVINRIMEVITTKKSQYAIKTNISSIFFIILICTAKKEAEDFVDLKKAK